MLGRNGVAWVNVVTVVVSCHVLCRVWLVALAADWSDAEVVDIGIYHQLDGWDASLGVLVTVCSRIFCPRIVALLLAVLLLVLALLKLVLALGQVLGV